MCRDAAYGTNTDLQIYRTEQRRRLAKMTRLVNLLQIVRLAKVCLQQLQQHGLAKVKELILFVVFDGICLLRMEVIRRHPVSRGFMSHRTSPERYAATHLR